MCVRACACVWCARVVWCVRVVWVCACGVGVCACVGVRGTPYLDIFDPASMCFHGITRQRNHLHVSFLELRYQLSHFGQLRGAHGCVVRRVGEKNTPTARTYGNRYISRTYRETARIFLHAYTHVFLTYLLGSHETRSFLLWCRH